MKKIVGFGIDCQRSFNAVVEPAIQQQQHDGELCVSGGWDDMVRAANLINKFDKLSGLEMTFDGHDLMHISHPNWFRNSTDGLMPNPFTQMREENNSIVGSVFEPKINSWKDVGQYITAVEEDYLPTIEYLKALNAGKKYPHIVWPPHCLIGTRGHNLVEPIAEALFAWEAKNNKTFGKTFKGGNPYREHFSAVKAEVIMDQDVRTHLNLELIKKLDQYDEILIFGQALSHCVASTIRDIANAEYVVGRLFPKDEFIKKCVLLTDCTSNVTGFESYGNHFLAEMTMRGMKTTTSIDYLY